MIRLVLLLLCLFACNLNVQAQTNRIVQPEQQLEASVAGVQQFFVNWSPRLNEAIKVSDDKSAVLIAQKISKTTSEVLSRMSEAEQDLDKAFVKQLNTLLDLLQTSETYSSAVQLMDSFIPDQH